MAKKAKGLTPKEEIFVREFLASGNATKAAIAAGYSPASAGVTGSKLLKKAKVSAELTNLRKKLLDKLEISAEKVLQGLAELAFFDPRKLFEQEIRKSEDGKSTETRDVLKSITDLDDVTVRALQGFEIEKLFRHFGKGQAEEAGTVTKIKFADRGLNLERLGRHFKLFTDKLEVSDAAGILARLKKGRERVAKNA